MSPADGPRRGPPPKPSRRRSPSAAQRRAQCPELTSQLPQPPRGGAWRRGCCGPGRLWLRLRMEQPPSSGKRPPKRPLADSFQDSGQRPGSGVPTLIIGEDRLLARVDVAAASLNSQSGTSPRVAEGIEQDVRGALSLVPQQPLRCPEEARRSMIETQQIEIDENCGRARDAAGTVPA